MAVAETSKPTEPTPVTKTGPNLIASTVLGAVLVLAGLGLVFRGIPTVWNSLAGGIDHFASAVLLAILQIAAAVGLLIAAGVAVGKSKNQEGLRGGTFLMVMILFVGYFVIRGLIGSLNSEYTSSLILGSLFWALCAAGLVLIFVWNKFTNWAIALDQGGWFSFAYYKRTQGRIIRRLTMIGLLIVGFSGIYTLSTHSWIPQNTIVGVLNGNTRVETSSRMGDWIIGGTLKSTNVKGDSEFAALDSLTRSLERLKRSENTPEGAAFDDRRRQFQANVAQTSKDLSQPGVIILPGIREYATKFDAFAKETAASDTSSVKTVLPDELKEGVDGVVGAIREEIRNRPRVEGGFTIVEDLAFVVPVVLIVVCLWFSWRLVNLPTFADFLIATEAEMNKVTWSTRKALVRDTIVVIVGILLMTLFLFVVDVTWNFLLSRDLKWLGVGGGRSTGILPTFEERQEYSTQKRTGDKAEW